MKLFFPLFFLLLLTACAKPPKPVWTELPSSEELVQRLTSTTGQAFSLDGAATVGLTVNGKHFSSQQFLLVQKPDRLRADVLTGFGQLILQLSSNGKELSVFTNTTVPGHFYRGPATAENISRFTRIPLATRSMVHLLLYDPPLIDYQQSTVSTDENGLLLRLENRQLQQELLFDNQLQLVGCRYFSGNELMLEVLYQKFDQEEHFPRTVRLNLFTEKTRATLKFSELRTNIEIAPERFQLKQPAHIPVENLPR
ncbi:DUF4292 domain-containing protein [Malonomonas rubra]|uniref:LolA family protein n=1 Tax=Malonomonas rubra TaxID=57040 RepID=UPI0026F1C68D|nr:DUF4292 domain-containing protein [Malonomonas rubra]